MTMAQQVVAGLPVWPQVPQLAPIGDPSIVAMLFDDHPLYHPALLARVMALSEDARFAKPHARAGGGTKVYHLDQWGCPEADLIHARAMALFRHTLGAATAVVDLSWANVYREHDFIVPHSHPRSTASIVYCLDPGDEDPAQPDQGRFCIVDPRVAPCCPIQAGCLTAGLMPAMPAGTMLIFPSQVVHYVTPYQGRRPRVTLSWNVNPHAMPGSPFDIARQRFAP